MSLEKMVIDFSQATKELEAQDRNFIDNFAHEMNLAYKKFDDELEKVRMQQGLALVAFKEAVELEDKIREKYAKDLQKMNEALRQFKDSKSHEVIQMRPRLTQRK